MKSELKVLVGFFVLAVISACCGYAAVIRYYMHDPEAAAICVLAAVLSGLLGIAALTDAAVREVVKQLTPKPEIKEEGPTVE